jgi:phosphatidate phosphatase APP1
VEYRWRRTLIRAIAAVEWRIDGVVYRLRRALGSPHAAQIVAYRGCGTATRLVLQGRVLEHRPPRPSRQSDRRWDNFRHMVRRLASAEIPYARLRARYGTLTQEAAADEEGMFSFDLALPAPDAANGLWREVEIELLAPLPRRQQTPIRATGCVLVPPPGARVAVVSDIDDTIIQTGAVNVLRMMGAMLFASAHTRSPFPGVAALYRALHGGCSGGEANPMFYVSSSPWNLYDLLCQFFELHDIPIGPVLFLRNWGISEEELLPLHHGRHKRQIIERLLAIYPSLPFLLIGDSGQQDAEIYAALVQDYPGRIAGIYIRNVSRRPERVRAVEALAAQTSAAGVPMELVADSVALARHAARAGWISPDALGQVRAQRAAEERRRADTRGREDTPGREDARARTKRGK